MLKGGVNKDGRKTSKDFCRRVCLACEFTRLEEILLRSTTMIIFSGNAMMCEFFFLIQPFSSFGLAGKNRGLISFLGSRTIRTIQFKFKYRSVFFFFILHSAPSQIDSYSKIPTFPSATLSSSWNELRARMAEHRFRILRSFSQHRPPYRFFALRKR